jgi:hypothetical protein
MLSIVVGSLSRGKLSVPLKANKLYVVTHTEGFAALRAAEKLIHEKHRFDLSRKPLQKKIILQTKSLFKARLPPPTKGTNFAAMM